MTEELKMTKGYGVWIMGHDAFPVAMFRYQESAEDWARDNFFGQWMMKEVKFPLMPFCTEEEYAHAKEEAKEMIKFFKTLPEDEAP